MTRRTAALHDLRARGGSADGASLRSRRAFSIAELLVVIGIIALLLAIVIPPLQWTRRRAMDTHCAAQLQQLGRALETVHAEYGFYPYTDDQGAPIRYTWIDVLIQLRVIGNSGSPAPQAPGDDGTPRPKFDAPGDVTRLGYCPLDARPDPLNIARNRDLIYPPTGRFGGVDYSYGLGVPLATGGWALQSSPRPADAGSSRTFRGHETRAASRILAADAYSPAIYNVSADALSTGVWNRPTQFDNTVAWARHSTADGAMGGANVLFQDSHVGRALVAVEDADSIRTTTMFVWQPGEDVHANPATEIEGLRYPSQLPPSALDTPRGDVFPDELLPRLYTQQRRWTLIGHK